MTGVTGKPGSRGILLLLAVLAVLLVGVLVRTAWLCDDAYITLRTVENLVEGYASEAVEREGSLSGCVAVRSPYARQDLDPRTLDEE